MEQKIKQASKNSKPVLITYSCFDYSLFDKYLGAESRDIEV